MFAPLVRVCCFSASACFLLAQFSTARAQGPPPLPGTTPLTAQGDLSAELVAGVDRFLLRQLDESVARRAQFWKRDFSSPEAYEKSVAPNRQHLAKILGIRAARLSFSRPEPLLNPPQALQAKSERITVTAVRWPVLKDPDPYRQVVSLSAVGLLVEPVGMTPQASVVAIPDADQTPEQLVGLAPGIAVENQFARRLAESGCRVIVPLLLDRHLEKRNGRANITNREFAYRSSFELGHHLLGYELQKVFAAVDWLARENPKSPLGVIGYGEGGGLALYAAALDQRIQTTAVCGYFGSRQRIWQEPLDRNVFGLLREFGDAELASLVAPRRLLIDSPPGPEVTLPSEGGAPARLVSSSADEVTAELARLGALLGPWKGDREKYVSYIAGAGGSVHICSVTMQSHLTEALGLKLAPATSEPPKFTLFHLDPVARQKEALEEILRNNQLLLDESSYVRAEFIKKLDTSSVEKYRQSVETYREIFRKEVIGQFDPPLLPAKPRARLLLDKEKWTAYEVQLDVWQDVVAYGVLLVPKNIPAGERRPVVVCQHGLEGRPSDVFQGDHPAYHDFAAKLAERGFVTFAPQNLYLGRDLFRTLQRKANPLGCSLFSIIVPQHQQIVNWLGTLPFCDKERIGFYGLSYGGKSAMRIPPLVTDYKLSICSADFNDWVDKNASNRAPYSYVWTNEYEIFEWDLANTFNYAEMAALICPRPFMVERGHFDGVGEDGRVAAEFAKVRHLYAALLHMPPDACQIEFFVGPHTINGQGSFDFLHRHLNWPKP